MKGIRKLLPWLCFLGMAACILVMTFLPGMVRYYTLLLFGAAGCCVAALLLAFENRRPSPRALMPVMVLVGTASVGRVVFAFLPQVQPVTVLVLCAGISLGPVQGFATGALSAVVSNLALGMGPWTLWQMLGWGVIGLLGGALGKLRLRQKWLVCAAALASGFLYGWIVDIWTVAFYGEGITLELFLTVYSAATLFNLIHSAGNLAFALLLYPTVCQKLDRVVTKYGLKNQS